MGWRGKETMIVDVDYYEYIDPLTSATRRRVYLGRRREWWTWE